MINEAETLIAQGRTVLTEQAQLAQRFADLAGSLAVNLVISGFIIALTIISARWAARGVRRGLGRLKTTREDVLLQQFGAQVARWAVIVVGAVAVLNRLGVETTSIIAILGAASLAIGLAMQGALSNVAAGVLLLLIRPYRVGDFVEVAGRTGTVRRLDLFTTELATPDNLMVMVPNSRVLGDVLVNFGAHPTRRIELTFDVHYDTDLERAVAVTKAAVEALPAILPDPEVWVGVFELRDSSMRLRLNAWVANPDWWETRAAVIKAVKEAYDREGIVIPYPHQIQIQEQAA